MVWWLARATRPVARSSGCILMPRSRSRARRRSGSARPRRTRQLRRHRRIERELGTCYCTALFFGPDGRLLGKHRKLMPTAMERMIWGFGDGSTLTVVDSPYGRIGSVICWENYMPMLRMAMYAKNVALYCAPTADDRDTWLSSMQHVALEGRCFVLTACQFLRKKDFPADRARVARRFARTRC